MEKNIKSANLALLRDSNKTHLNCYLETHCHCHNEEVDIVYRHLVYLN